VLVGTGATLFYFGRRSRAGTRETPIAASFVLDATPGAVLTGLAGGF
jgi:hypothetical protein